MYTLLKGICHKQCFSTWLIGNLLYCHCQNDANNGGGMYWDGIAQLIIKYAYLFDERQKNNNGRTTITCIVQFHCCVPISGDVTWIADR